MENPIKEKLKRWFLNQNKKWEKDHPKQDEENESEEE